MRFMLTLLLILFASSVQAQVYEPRVVRVFAGANGVWYGGDLALPEDFEFGTNAAASLSPHISAVGGIYYGLEHSYLRGSIGARVTATDVQDQDFSIGVGVQYHASTEPVIRPEEWAGDVSVGWRPYPQNMPRVILVGQGWYGFESEQLGGLVGVRYHVGSFGRP
jgi:hypothetical protein